MTFLGESLVSRTGAEGWTESWVKVPMCVQRYDIFGSSSLHNLGGKKLSCPCYHTRHFQQIHWNWNCSANNCKTINKM